MRAPLSLLLLGAIILASLPAAADDRAAALEVDRRLYLGISGFTAQSRISADGAIGGGRDTLSDGPMLRFGRTGRPARYDVEILRTGYDEGELLLAMASLDYLIPWGDLFSGFVGVVAGYARIEWDGDDPLDGDGAFGVDGSRDGGAVGGVRAGGLIEVTELVQVEIGYRFLHTDIRRRFRDGDTSATARVRNIRIVHAGVNFRF